MKHSQTTCSTCRYYFKKTCRFYPPRPLTLHETASGGKYITGFGWANDKRQTHVCWPPVQVEDFCNFWMRVE